VVNRWNIKKRLHFGVSSSWQEEGNRVRQSLCGVRKSLSRLSILSNRNTLRDRGENQGDTVKVLRGALIEIDPYYSLNRTLIESDTEVLFAPA
jgi:hypothetical protein